MYISSRDKKIDTVLFREMRRANLFANRMFFFIGSLPMGDKLLNTEYE
jgi:hypothetical protein